MKVYNTNDSAVIPILTLGDKTILLSKYHGEKRWTTYDLDTKFVELVKRDNPSTSVNKLSSEDKKIIISVLFESELV